MATMNILSASIEGKLGSLYGVKQKKYHVIKATPFSHSPHNEAQTKSVRAFEKLCRLSGGIAAVFFDYLGLKDKTLLKHNIVAKWLKPIIKDKMFTPSNIFEVIQESENINFTTFEYDEQKYKLSIEVENTRASELKDGESWCIILFDNNGKVILKEALTASKYVVETQKLFYESETLQILVLENEIENKKNVVRGALSAVISLDI